MRREWEDAIERGDVHDVRALLQVGCRPDARDRYGQTGVMLAAVRGHADVVRLLADAGADLDVTAKHGLSALMLAVVNGHRDVVAVLVDAGADQTLRGTGAAFTGRTARDLAEAAGDSETAALLRPA